MKTHKLNEDLLKKIISGKEKISSYEINNLKLRLNLAQNQINLLQINAELEKEKSILEGILIGFASAKKLDIDSIKLSDDGLSIIEDVEHNN
jgi:hypothetical protein